MTADIVFKFETARKIVDALENCAEDAQSAKSYIGEYTDLSISEQGIINLFSGAHADLVTRVNRQLDDIRTYLYTSLSTNLVDTFALLRSNDDAVGRKFETLEEFFQADHTMMDDRREYAREHDLPGGDPDTGTASNPFKAPHDPTSRLTGVSVGNDSVYARPEPSAVLDYFSLTFIVRQVCIAATDKDPLDFVGRQLAGNWDKFTVLAKALRKLANGVADIASNLCAHADQLEQGWEGNSYAAANVAMYDAAKQMRDGTVKPLRDLADKYEEAAENAHQTYRDLEGSINGLIDIATGFGLVGSLFKTGAEAVKGNIADKVDDIMTTISTFRSTSQSMKSQLKSIEGDFTKFKSVDGVPPVLDEYEKR